MSAYILNLSAYDTYYAKEPDVTVTPTTPMTTILLATYEVSLTTYQFPVITYDPYKKKHYPILNHRAIDLDQHL